MVEYLRYAGQALAYGLFVGVVGYFSSAPAYVHLDPELALIKLSFSHAGQTRGECRRRTDEELARLAPNMRTPYDCPRERSPITVALELDGKPLYAAELPPTGFTRDGASTVYQRFPVAAGTHRLRARLKDSGRVPDFNYVKEAEVTLAPAQVFVVDFNARTGGFVFK